MTESSGDLTAISLCIGQLMLAFSKLTPAIERLCPHDTVQCAADTMTAISLLDTLVHRDAMHEDAQRIPGASER